MEVKLKAIKSVTAEICSAGRSLLGIPSSDKSYCAHFITHQPKIMWRYSTKHQEGMQRTKHNLKFLSTDKCYSNTCSTKLRQEIAARTEQLKTITSYKGQVQSMLLILQFQKVNQLLHNIFTCTICMTFMRNVLLIFMTFRNYVIKCICYGIQCDHHLE